MEMHSYTVELRIEGKDLPIDQVTRTLGCKPTSTRLAGQKLTDRKTYDKTLWSYEVYPPAAAATKSWDSLEEGLTALLARFAPQQSAIADYQNRFDVYLWVGHFSSSFGGGPIFSADLLRSLGDFGVKLLLDTYQTELPQATD